MASLIEAIEIKRKMFFEHEGAPYHCLDVEVSKPTARGGQTLVRLKMRNLITRAVFDKTFKAGEKFKEPDLVVEPATYAFALVVFAMATAGSALIVRRRLDHLDLVDVLKARE